MSFSNPRQPEGINVTAENPLREFAVLLFGFGALVLVAVLLLSWSAQWLARFVPFSVEQTLADTVLDELASPLDDASRAREAHIRTLAERLLRHVDDDNRIPVVAHYDTGATENAFATLGGHIVLYRGLVDQIPHENALAMLVAHEIAHVQLRHPIVASSRGLTVALAIGALVGFTDNAAAGSIANWLGVGSMASFSRAQERAADALAAELVRAEYGHLHGAADLFAVLLAAHGESALDDFVATHPGLDERIAELGAVPGVAGKTTPLPWSAADVAE